MPFPPQIEENIGMPLLYSLCEAVKEYLVENNKPKGDGSVHEEIMKKMAAQREKEAEKEEEEAKRKEVSSPCCWFRMLSLDGALRCQEAVLFQRRKEGTPVTPETFAEWQAKFLKEMSEIAPKRVLEGVSGREYFEEGGSLARSDAAIIAGAEAEAAALEGGGAGGGVVVEGAIDTSVFAEEDSDLSDLEDSDDEED